jgi:beta-lactam-binding protein with PASTA domain
VKSYELKYEIIDSVFDESKQKGVVVNQDPLPNTDVKKNRKVYLTINSMKVRKVNFPDVFDLTLRQAVSKLQNNGLEVGKLEYQPDIATNKVLAFKVNGIAIAIGQELYYGTTIDLVVGQGLSNEKVIVPNLIGLSRLEANIILKSTSLNVGLEYFNNEVSDSSLAVIYKQYPEVGESRKISIGSAIDLYFESPKKDAL